MAKIGIGLDMGADAVKVVVGRMKKGFFSPSKAAILKRDGGGPADVLSQLYDLGIHGEAIVGVTGRDMIIRYTQVPPMPDWQLKQVMGFEIQDLSTQSGGDLSADFNRLDIASSLAEDDTVLLTLIKNDYLDEAMGALAGTRVSAVGFTPNAIALYNLMARTADVESGTTLVMSVGAENIDIALIQDGSLIFARNLSGGAKLFNHALEQGFNLKPARAEAVKRELGIVLSRGRPAGASPQQVKVGRTLAGPAGQILSMIQSSLMFCKAQIKVADLKLDKVLLTGGGARLSGLDAYLSDNLGVPVKRYDPAEFIDLSGLEVGTEYQDAGYEFATATGLALMACDPDHYSIQILPEAVRKKQFFMTHTVFGLLAAFVLIVFLGLSFYLDMTDAGELKKDIRKRQSLLSRKKQDAAETERLMTENLALTERLNLLDKKIIPATGLLRTLHLVQRYLPEDLWVMSIETDMEEREEFGEPGGKRPVIRVRGSGREMGQPLQKSFTEFRTKLDADPLTEHVIPQVRYENFSFTLTINYSSYPASSAQEQEEKDQG